MDTPAQVYRQNAAGCLRIAKTMDRENRRRFEHIAQQWLELAQKQKEEYLQAGNEQDLLHRSLEGEADRVFF
jgi:hypothetical protein